MATVARTGAEATGSTCVAVFSGYGIGFSQGSVLTGYFKLAIFTWLAAYWGMALLDSTSYYVRPGAISGNQDFSDFRGVRTT
ncbi:MAG: hypothetical protein KBE22_11380 [Candidatus Accumulibacter sp.]|jgi:hypothetical protein|nr:hypothetical protein [Accumulibacter sp.]